MAKAMVDVKVASQAFDELKSMQPTEISAMQFVMRNYSEIIALREQGFSCKQIFNYLQSRGGLKCTHNSFKHYIYLASLKTKTLHNSSGIRPARQKRNSLRRAIEETAEKIARLQEVGWTGKEICEYLREKLGIKFSDTCFYNYYKRPDKPKAGNKARKN